MCRQPRKCYVFWFFKKMIDIENISRKLGLVCLSRTTMIAGSIFYLRLYASKVTYRSHPDEHGCAAYTAYSKHSAYLVVLHTAKEHCAGFSLDIQGSKNPVLKTNKRGVAHAGAVHVSQNQSRAS